MQDDAFAGKGRVFQCLQQSLAQPDFGQACRAQVEERGQRMQVLSSHCHHMQESLEVAWGLLGHL